MNSANSLRRRLFFVSAWALMGLPWATPAAAATANCPASLDFTAPRLQDDSAQNLCQFAGKVILVVNTASYCGFTPQYEGLVELHAKFAERGFTVLGFPSNDFQQEAKDSKTIADLCFNTYGVKFPMFAQTSVVGGNAHPFFAALARSSGQAPRWNFHKYLIDRDGRVVANFPSTVAPTDRRLTAQIELLVNRRGPG